VTGGGHSRGALVVLASVAALAAALALAAPAGAAFPLRCNGEQRTCVRHLDEVALPAAHNAMSARSLGWQIPNQPVGIPDQLREGVRGFLVDTYYGHETADGTVVTDPVKKPQSRLYLCHVACALGATPLVDVLRAMHLFLVWSPNNVLVIVNEDYVSPEDFAEEVRRSGLIRNVYRGRPGPRWPTVRQMILARQQVVMLAEHDSGGVPWYHEAYNGVLQETPYSWPVPSLLTTPANWPATCIPNRGGRTGSLFLMNHWSPTVAPDPAVSAQVNATDVLTGRARACQAARGKLPNIVAVDMFQSGGLFEAVRRQNAGAP
jgi:hypothetical protein